MKRLDRESCQRGIQFLHEIGTVIDRARVAVDLKGDRHAVICVVAQVEDISGGPSRHGHQEGGAHGDHPVAPRAGWTAGGITAVTAPARLNMQSRFHQITARLTAASIQVSHGCASGQNGLMSCQ